MSELFSSRLRAATLVDHSSAEQAPFLADLTTGRLTLEAHTALTVQHYLIYDVLEQAADLMRHDHVAGRFVSDDLTRLSSLGADLAHLLGTDWRDALIPNAATAEYTERLREVGFIWPAGFVAHHYNRYLGDLSGGQYLAKAIARVYDLPIGGPGLLFYRFGQISDLAAFKHAYRASLNITGWDTVEEDRVIEEVRHAYRLNAQVLAAVGRQTAHLRGPFPAEVVAQIMKHMNDDHAADSLLICRTLGGQPNATAAVMSGMDADGIEFTVTVHDVATPVRVPFATTLTERAQVRVEVTRLHERALAAA
jgi:heme oxygenase